MESSGPSSNASDHPKNRWTGIMGTTIAVLTLALPVLVIAYYSSTSSVESLPRSTISVPRTRN